MTPVPCPCCRAANDAGPLCRRCKADLGPLFAAAARRSFALAAARDCVRRGDLPAARRWLREAEAIRPGPDTARTAALVRLLAGDFPAALAARTHAVNPGRS